MSIMDLRTKAAFGGVMGKDGRKAYVGGSYSGSTSSSGKGSQGSGKGYQGGSGAPGSAESKGMGGSGGYSDNTPSPTVRAKEKAKYEKQFGGVSPTGSRPRSYYARIKKYNSDIQKKANIKLAQRNAFLAAQDVEQYVDPFDDYTMDGVKAAIARGYKVDGTGVMPKNNSKYKLPFPGARTIIPDPDYIDPNSGSVTFTGYDSNPLTNPDATDPSLGYDFSNLDKGMKTLTSNKGTSIEKTRPNLYRVNSNIPGRAGIVGNFLANKIRPDTQVTAQNTLDQLALGTILAGDPNITREKVLDLSNRGKTQEQIDGLQGTGGDNNQPFIPYLPQEEVEDEYTNDFTYRGDGIQRVGRDVTDATYAADGGIMGTRARRAMGGIMGRVDQRQQFFLGGIGKAIKGAFSGVVDATKKVLKSPIGQAALIYAGGTYLGGMKAFGGTGAGFSNFGSRLMSPMGGNSFGSLFSNSRNAKNAGKGIFGRAKGLKDKYDDMGTFGRMATMGGIGLGLSMIPGLNKAKPNETNFSDRGGPLLNSQGDGSQGSISREIQDAYRSGDSQRIAELQKYYNYMLPVPGAVQDLSLPSSARQLPYPNYAEGGRIGKAEGGLMNLGGMEKDYRNDGGFVPIGEYEKKDDVPARLSVNEFVFTADAVRNAGEGDIDKGAEVMENMMKNLENGGTVSEESQGNQGNTGAQDMFSVSQRLGEVI